MSFPKPLLNKLAQEKQLTERETEVFIALFGDGKTRLEIAEYLNVQESAISTCLSGVYRKFAISGDGPVKESRLKDELRRRDSIWQRQQSHNEARSSLSKYETVIDLLQKVRERCCRKLFDQYNKMRLLSGDEIGVDQLYVDVWVLNRSPRTFQISLSRLLETFDLRHDRLGLGDRIKRNPGFEVANSNSKLVILGKPGSGKTTFIRHLTIDWCKGSYQSDLVAVLVELRRIRDTDWKLTDSICKELELKEDQLVIFLEQGKLLILMDGLDEVPTNELRREVQDQLQKLAKDYPKNRFILTCRTQIIVSIPDGFTSVEVADFNEEQVGQFVKNWFKASGQSAIEVEQRWERFNNVIDKRKALKELTVTPVLLSLMCLVFQDEGAMPLDMTWLYKKGIQLLLNKWNDGKAIDGWEVGSEAYRQLNVEQKEALLAEIAAHKFENPNNFVLFQQEEIVTQITKYLGLSNDVDGIAVLKSIEAQHGLLIERADELWSFSHLTFQEHFTVQWLTKLSTEQLSEKITNQQWQGVVKQLVTSQQPADQLVRLIRQAICTAYSPEKTSPKLRSILAQIRQKSGSLKVRYKLAAVKVIYFACERALVDSRNLARERILDLDVARTLDQEFAQNLCNVHNLDHEISLDLALVRTLARALAYDLTTTFSLIQSFIGDLNLSCEISSDSVLKNRLKALQELLPNVSESNWDGFKHFWQNCGHEWREDLRQIMNTYRNIGHNWKLDDDEVNQLQSYYQVNGFLVSLINISEGVSDTIRTEIEDTILII
jgi:DNA-binding CsgD family transcriptional regulator